MEGAAGDKTLLLLQVQRQAKQDVRKGQEAVVRRDGPNQDDQIASSRSTYERSLPQALSDIAG